MHDYLTAQEAATALGITYPTLLARIRRGKIKATKKGWAVLIHRDEIKRLQGEQSANTSNLEKRSR